MDNISNYLAERDRLRASIGERRKRVTSMLYRFNNENEEKGGFISVDDFRDLEMGKEYPVSEGVYFIPIRYNAEFMEFHTVIKGGYFYGIQWHDKVEVCKVTKGELVDMLTNERCGVGQDMTFQAYTKHKPGAYVDTESNVKFYL